MPPGTAPAGGASKAAQAAAEEDAAIAARLLTGVANVVRNKQPMMKAIAQRCARTPAALCLRPARCAVAGRAPFARPRPHELGQQC